MNFMHARRGVIRNGLEFGTVTVVAQHRRGTAPRSVDSLRMETTKRSFGPLERAPRTKRELWFTMIRVTIVAALVGIALWMLAVAYAPQPTTPLATLDVVCPSPVRVAERSEAVAAPQTACIVQPTVLQPPQRAVVVAAPQQRAVVVKKDEKRVAPKKPAAQPSVRANHAPVRSGKIESPTSHPPTTQTDRPSPLIPTLAQTDIGRSPFGDMHGQ